MNNLQTKQRKIIKNCWIFLCLGLMLSIFFSFESKAIERFVSTLDGVMDAPALHPVLFSPPAPMEGEGEVASEGKGRLVDGSRDLAAMRSSLPEVSFFSIGEDGSQLVERLHFDEIPSTFLWARSFGKTYPITDSRWRVYTANTQRPDLVPWMFHGAKGYWFSPRGNLYAAFNFIWTPNERIPLSTLEEQDEARIVLEIGFAQVVVSCLCKQGVEYVHTSRGRHNDVFCRGQKIGATGTTFFHYPDRTEVCINIGINVNMPQYLCNTLDQPATSMQVALGRLVDTDILLKSLAEECYQGFQRFLEKGTSPFITSLKTETSLAFYGLRSTFSSHVRVINFQQETTDLRIRNCLGQNIRFIETPTKPRATTSDYSDNLPMRMMGLGAEVYTGVFEGIDDEKRLILREENGTVHFFEKGYILEPPKSVSKVGIDWLHGTEYTPTAKGEMDLGNPSDTGNISLVAKDGEEGGASGEASEGKAGDEDDPDLREPKDPKEARAPPPVVKKKELARDAPDDKFVQRLADKADRKYPGRGPRVGQLKHKWAERLLKRYQEMTGEKPHLHGEKRFYGGKKWREGQDPVKGSKIVDVWDNLVRRALDYKFGGARVTPAARASYARVLPKQSKPLTQVKPTGK